jgi:hypothetical protein
MIDSQKPKTIVIYMLVNIPFIKKGLKRMIEYGYLPGLWWERKGDGI